MRYSDRNSRKFEQLPDLSTFGGGVSGARNGMLGGSQVARFSRPRQRVEAFRSGINARGPLASRALYPGNYSRASPNGLALLLYVASGESLYLSVPPPIQRRLMCGKPTYEGCVVGKDSLPKRKTDAANGYTDRPACRPSVVAPCKRDRWQKVRAPCYLAPGQKRNWRRRRRVASQSRP